MKKNIRKPKKGRGMIVVKKSKLLDVSWLFRPINQIANS